MRTIQRMNRIRAASWLAATLATVGVQADQTSPTPAPTGGGARPTQAVPRESCVTAECHPNVKRHEVVHGPVSVNSCDACHQPVSEVEHTFKLTREKTAVCTFCHEIDVRGAAVVHRPLTTGECMECHDPHGGTNRYLLKAASASELCKNCHTDVIGGKSVVHGPVAAGACGACHSPHTSRYPKLLAAEGVALCLQCHVSTQEQLEKMRVIHGPVATDCLACHEAHSANHKMILKKEPKELCESCHEEVRAAIAGSKTQHDAVTTERACLNCHDPHASDYPRIVRTKMVDLCFECHDREIDMPDGRKLGNIKAVITSGKSLHGPVAQDNCAACHLIHGGDNFRLLVKEYPPEFYAPFKEESYALCFNCHERQLVHDEKTTALTNFRNGDLNLHFLHVNKKTKGRTCRACHETHASTKEKHIRDSVPFGSGGWMLPINFEKMAAGGRCAPGCHLPYEYNRDKPLVYPTPDKPATWQEPRAASQPAIPPASQPASKGGTP